jgi:NADPH-dependent curcumin reductase CurA
MPTAMNRINQRWLLTARPQGPARATDFSWEELPADRPGVGQVLVRAIYL